MPRKNELDRFGSFDSLLHSLVEAMLAGLADLSVNSDGARPTPTPGETRNLIFFWRSLPEMYAYCGDDWNSNAWQYVLGIWREVSLVILADAVRHGVDCLAIDRSAALMLKYLCQAPRHRSLGDRPSNS